MRISIPKSERGFVERYGVDSGGLELVSEYGGFSVGSHPVLVYIASLSSESRRTMRASLDSIAGFVSGARADALSLSWDKLEYRHTAAIRAALAEVYAPSTANKMLSALKGVLRECFRLEYISAEQFSRACDLPSVKGSRESKGRSLSREELFSLLRTCSIDQKIKRGARDYSIISVMYSLGLRRSEVVKLDLNDYSRTKRQLTIRAGKGNKDRISPVTQHLQDAIENWTSLRGTTEGPLFLPVTKSDVPRWNRMTDQAVLYILQRRGREADIESFTPHDLRRTFIGDLLDAGADLATVQHLAGHSNVQTTARYDRRGEEAKRRAAELLTPPQESS